MSLTRRELLISATALAASAGFGVAAEPTTVRVGLLQFGTASWEIEVIRRYGLDAARGLHIEPVRLASNDAARIAFLAGEVDTIVTDLLLAARLRAEGHKIVYLPFSATEGAVMVPAGSPIRAVQDLRGRSIGVAGGALDKSWLLLKAYAKREAGLDLTSDAKPVFGAPPLLTQKLEEGEFDAGLLYWNFCARLEAKGFRRLIGAGDLAMAFGATGDIALIGYVFDEAFLAKNPKALSAFAGASRQAKELMASRKDVWESVRPLMQAEDDASFDRLKQRFLEGIPKRAAGQERADAERLYALLAELGGERLVGPARELPAGLYWEGRPDGS